MGQHYGRLTVIASADNIGKRTAWLCRCECGNQIIVKTDLLRSKTTKSCGCLNMDVLKTRNANNTFGRIYNDPKEASAKHLWRAHYLAHELSFDSFMKISQSPCHYCSQSPLYSNSYNSYLNQAGKIVDGVSLDWANKATFTYNGLDRIDSNQSYITGNVVSSCWVCNRTKRERTYDQFIEHIRRLIAHKDHRISPDEHRQLSQAVNIDKLTDKTYYAHKSTVNKTYADYNDGDMTLEQFYRLSQLDCFYCQTSPSNKANTHTIEQRAGLYAQQTGNFIYNGVDRISVLLPHNFSNCVSACKYCNYGKQGMTLIDFYAWIDRLEITAKEKDVL